MQFKSSKTPQDVYAVSGIAAGTRVQIQNKSSRPLMIFAGDSPPASLDDYFVVDSWVWAEYQGTVIMVWSNHKNKVMVQAS